MSAEFDFFLALKWRIFKLNYVKLGLCVFVWSVPGPESSWRPSFFFISVDRWGACHLFLSFCIFSSSVYLHPPSLTIFLLVGSTHLSLPCSVLSRLFHSSPHSSLPPASPIIPCLPLFLCCSLPPSFHPHFLHISTFYLSLALFNFSEFTVFSKLSLPLTTHTFTLRSPLVCLSFIFLVCFLVKSLQLCTFGQTQAHFYPSRCL